MDTGRGIGAEKVATWRSQLALEATDQLCLLAWWPSREALPLTRHLVLGPVLRLGHEPAESVVRTMGADGASKSHRPAAGSSGERPSADEEEVDAAPDALSVSELDEQLSEQEADPSQAAAADRAPDGCIVDHDTEGAGPGGPLTEPRPLGPGPSMPDPVVVARPTDLSHLPAHDPRRLRQALRWRRRRAQRRARRFASRQIRRAKSLGPGVRHLPSGAVKRSLSGRSDSLSWEFALMTTRSSTVNDLFATADVVVPVDARSHKAAWFLARRHPGPDVLVTVPAAARALAERRRKA